MLQSISRTEEMAFPDTTRSFKPVGITATSDRKSMAAAFGNDYGSANVVWGTDSIWSNNTKGSSTNGFTSRAIQRDTAATGEGARHNSIGEEKTAEKKSGGFNGLTDLPDTWKAPPRSTNNRALPSGRSISATKYNDNSSFQPRTATNAGLPSLTTTASNFSNFASRPQPINLTATSAAHTRPIFASSYSNGPHGRSADQPPNVYTKFDRPADPNARGMPDSAKEGSWSATYSPTDDRKSSMSTHFSSRPFSQSTSREGSKPPSRHGMEAPAFTMPDYSRPSQRPTQYNSRAPSISSQSNSMYGTFGLPNADQLAMHLGQVDLSGNSRPQTANRPGAAAPWLNTPYMYAPENSALQTQWYGTDMNLSMTPDSDDVYDEQGLPQKDMTQRFGNDAGLERGGYRSDWSRPTQRLAHVPTAPVFRPGQPYAAANSPTESFESIGMPAFLLNGSGHKESLRQSRAGPLAQSEMYPLELLAQYRDSYSQPYSPFSMASGFQSNPAAYSPYYSSGIPMDDGSLDDRAGPGMIRSILLHEFRNNPKSRRYELKDIYDHIAEFSGDQHGSRFIQTKLETANSDEKDRVFHEIEPNAMQLMTDVFGNYVIQKFFEHGDQTHKKILASKLNGHVLELSKSMYGCRVVQKALDHVLVDQQAELVAELKTHVIECVKDQNGNHVIQKAIERCAPHTIQFIFAAFQGQVQTLSLHAYGCRVIQRCLERCDQPSKKMVMMELTDCIQGMIQDQFGNYVVQHIVKHDDGEAKHRVLDIVGRNLEMYSKHKFASNVVETCLDFANDLWKRQVMITIALSNPHRAEGDGVFVSLIKDSYGNYVIQKLLDTLNDDDYRYFLDSLTPAILQAKRTGCPKQIISIENKMKRFATHCRSTHQASNGYVPAHMHHHQQHHRYPLALPMAAYATNLNSAANTPPPLTADASLQSSVVPSLNGDAVEGAAGGFGGGYKGLEDGFGR